MSATEPWSDEPAALMAATINDSSKMSHMSVSRGTKETATGGLNGANTNGGPAGVGKSAREAKHI
jgi:hypothetical protein